MVLSCVDVGISIYVFELGLGCECEFGDGAAVVFWHFVVLLCMAGHMNGARWRLRMHIITAFSR